jgi:hypothetical protein
MPATEMIVFIAVVTALTLGFIHVVRLAGTAMLHKTVRRVVDRDPARADELIARLGQPQEAAGDDRLAVILIAVGLAMVGASVIGDDTGTWMRYGIAGALFPLIVGSALWLRLHFIERARRRAEGK